MTDQGKSLENNIKNTASHSTLNHPNVFHVKENARCSQQVASCCHGNQQGRGSVSLAPRSSRFAVRHGETYQMYREAGHLLGE